MSESLNVLLLEALGEWVEAKSVYDDAVALLERMPATADLSQRNRLRRLLVASEDRLRRCHELVDELERVIEDVEVPVATSASVGRGDGLERSSRIGR